MNFYLLHKSLPAAPDEMVSAIYVPVAMWQDADLYEDCWVRTLND